MIPEGGGAVVESFNILRMGVEVCDDGDDVRRVASETLTTVLALRVSYTYWRHVFVNSYYDTCRTHR